MAELAAAHGGAQQVALPRTGHAIVMWPAYTARQVIPMRFSSLFPPASQPPQAVREEPARENPGPVSAPAQDLPDDLDARVRLVGEWQLGEG
jgi:hypothetical protein